MEFIHSTLIIKPMFYFEKYLKFYLWNKKNLRSSSWIYDFLESHYLESFWTLLYYNGVRGFQWTLTPGGIEIKSKSHNLFSTYYFPWTTYQIQTIHEHFNPS